MDFESDLSLKEWAKDKPLSILQLDPADRAVLRIADERDAIQKKTFTKWVNKHLKKTYAQICVVQDVPDLFANRHITDLFTDLQDGLNLISLLEVLSGEQLHREKGRMRFHALQNVELVLNFLRYKKIKLVNIRPEDIVDGNPKLTLGLIWTIILHFQISDIVVGEEPNVSARDVLLRWARKSTSRYPGVKVSDFTSSWRDGLAFNALIHRNRPDLIDWHHVRQRNVRERLETAFSTAEKVGVTRLLDPEDVDTHEIDEKSIITYISSMYDVFPEPPQAHPLHDNEGQSLTNEYRDVASSIHLWIREKTSYFSDRSVPNNFDPLLKLSQDVQKFKAVEVPQRAAQRMELNRLYTDLQKIFESTGEVDIEPELHVDVLERGWNKLMSLVEERDHQLQEELKKFEKFDRLAERCSRDIKRLDGRLDDVESRLKEEARRLERLHPMDAKRNADAIESELRAVEESLQSVSRDVATLKSVNHVTAPNLEKKLSKVHQKWVSLRAALHQKLISRLASLSFPVVEERTVTRQTRTVLETRLVDTNHHFRSLQQAVDWCKQKLKQLQETELGNDVPGVKIELAHHQREHKEIDKFQSTVDQCVAAKSQFQGEEQNLYSQHLNALHKAYSELLTFSTKRMSDLESLLDFLNSAQNLLNWLTGKENIEVSRDWSDPNINLPAVEQYHETLMSELEKREVSVRSVIERGNSLALQGHPGAKTISRWTELMKETWSRLLQFSLACEIHTEATRKYQEFMKDLREAEAWLASRDELLNTVYSASEFSLDEGERLLKGMQELREELNKRASAFAELASRAPSIPPIKARRQPVTRPIQINAVCNYSSQEDQVFIEKDDVWLLHDNSALTHWRVSNLSRASQDTNVPSVVFMIPPPGKEPLEGAERLNRAFERTTSLWQRKQMRLRQNMIFATIRVVRSWDLAQFVGMGSEQRSAIRRALNEDADKLLSEGDPGDPQLRRLRREMDEVNRLFDEFERRARQEDEQKAALREFNEMVTTVQTNLDEFERVLNQRLVSPIPRDPHSLERLVLQHKTFETELKALTPQIDGLQSALNALPRKPPQAANKVESLLQQWNSIWNYSHLYVERLKCAEIVLASLDEAKNVVSELEIKLAGFGELPSELEPLRLLHDDLIRVQNAIAARQPVVDQLIDDATNVRRVVVKSRERTTEREHHDLDRLDEDVNSVTRRWNDLCANLVERLRSCEQAGALLDNFGQTYQTEIKFIDESYQQLNSLPPVSQAKHHVEPTKVLFTSIVERTQPLEQVNIDGGRFIREAKIYSASMKRFEEATAVNNPSYDIVEDRPVHYTAVEEKLDNLNQRFLTLASVMQDRLRQLAALITDDQQLQDYVSGLQPVELRTFRTVFSLSETTKQIAKWTENGNMGNVQNGSNGAADDELEGVKNPQTGAWMSLSEAIKSRVLDLRSGTVLIESGKRIPVKDAVDLGVMRVGGSHLVEEARRELKSAEGGVAVSRPKVAFKKFLDSLSGRRGESGTLPPVEEQTSEWTLRQVVEQGILNTERGVFLIPGTDREVSLYECVKLGYINHESAIVVKSPGKEFNLKRALDKGVISKFGFVDGDNLSAAIAKGRVIYKDKISEDQAKKNRVKLKVTKSINPEQLALWGHYDVARCQFKNFKAFLQDLEDGVQVRGPSGELIPLKPEYFDDAGNYLAGAVAVPFLRAVKMGWIVGPGKEGVSHSASSVDEIKFEDFPEAVLNNTLDPDLVKIKLSDKGYVPLRQAVNTGALDLKSGASAKLMEAFENLEIRPNRPGCSLEALLKKTEDGSIKDPLTGRRLTLKEALECELVDPSLTQVYDSHSAKWSPLTDLKNLEEPLSPGHVATVWPSPLSIPKALESNVYCKHSNKFYDPRIDEEVTLKEALESHLLDPSSILVRDPKNDNCLPLENASEILDLDKGTFRYPTKMSLGEAYRKGYVLPSAPPMTLPEAVLQGLSTQKGILIKNEVMPVIDSLEAQLIRDTKCLVNDDNLITPSEAIESEQMDPVSGKYKGISLTECLATNILLPLKSLTFEEAELLNLLQDQAPKHRLPIARMSIKEAIESNHLNPVTGLYTKTEPKLRFREACDFHLDPNSALVKDTLAKKYISLTKSFKSGLVNDTGHVLDKSSSTLVPLSSALSTNLMSLGSFTLFDSLDYSLYSPTSGTFLDPMNKRRVKLSTAVESNLIMPDSVVVRCQTDEFDRFVDLKTALDMKLIDGETSMYKESETSLVDLDVARDKGYIILASRRQAAEEKYKFCQDSFRQLFDWLAEVESRLAAQQPASENVDGLRNQINVLKLIKEELDSQFKMVTSVQDDARAVISTGGEFFTREEISTLEKASKNLKTRYERALATTERLLKRLGSAGDELKKFRSETQIFSDWLEKAKKTAIDKEKSATLSVKNESVSDYLSDVIAHQADLRFITMSAQKFADESKEYLNAVNEFRGALMSRPGLIEPPVTSELKQLVTRLTAEYKELLARVNALSDRMSTLGSKTKEYKAALERARQWMSSAEPSANKVLSESLGADPSSLDEQLSRCKILYTEFTAQSRLFDQLKAALDALVRSLDPDRARHEAKELTRPVDELVTRYETLHGALKSRISALQNALEASQGVESSLEQVLAWLNTAENNIKTLSRPASLIKPRLDEQVRNARAPLADIEEKKPTVESVALQAKQLVASATNPRLAKRIESKLRDMQTRYEKLLERTLRLNESLNEVSKSLDDFEQRARDIEKWLVETAESVNAGGPGAAEAAAVERDRKKDSVEKLLRDGRNLVSRKDVTDTSAVRDTIKNIESQFRDLSNLIDEKSRLARLRSEQSLSYEKLKEQILAWIAAFENRLSQLEPVALHADILKRQTDEIKPLVKEHREYAINIDKLYELGAALETLERPDSPVRRVSSPIKRLSTTLGRRSSQELTSPSPTKFFAASPVSPAASSGFGSRRSSSSQDVLGTPTGLSATARETLEISDAYTNIGHRLSERSAELDQTREELKRALEQMKTLDGFIERTSRNLPRESLPASREEADKLNKIVKGLLEDIYEKQYLLDNTKTTVNELLRRKAAAPGSEALERQLNELTTKWKTLYDICKLRITLFEDLKDLYDTLDHLTGWLSAKERLVNALGPISSDPRMVASQVEQVQVLREEMRATKPQLDHLEETTRSLAARANWHALESKLNQVQERWNSLAKKLDDRAACLGAAADSSREFDSGLSRLRDTLQNISDQIDSTADEKDPEQVLRKLNACDRQLEGARQLLADAEAAGEHLCSVLTDPGSRAEIQSKLAAVNKQYNQLQSKLDQRKAEIEGYLKDGRELDLELAKTVGWLGEELASLNNDRLLVSADKDQLIAQVETHEPIYKEVLGREHQIVMLLDKAQGLLKTSEKAQYRNLENLRFQWDKLKKEVLDRHTRLHTSLEHCRKYYKSYDSFLPWLNQCEVKFESLSPESFSRRELDKHLRDLASFRNDIWKKSGEYEHLRSLSETFLGSCDIDKERVTKEMQNVKNRWERLNHDLLNRTTALEEIGRKIADASDRLRSLAHSVQRCEDRLGSHDTLAGTSDPAQLARLAGIKDEVLSLAAPLESLGHTCAEIDEEIAHVANSRAKSSGLSEEVQALRERLEDLSSRLSDRVDRAQTAAKAVQQYNDKVKLIVTDLSTLEDELAQMKPPGRDMKTLRSQQDQLSTFNSKVNRAGDNIAVMASLADSLIDSGFSPDVTRQQAEAINKRLANLESASRKREEQLDRAVDKLKNFLDSIQEADNLLGVALDEVKRLKPVASEPEVIRSQQEETRRLREEVVEPAGAAVDASLALGQELVASAAPGVSTNAVEKECERLTDRWSSLKEKMLDRERRLDVGLLQSGKFQEAVEGLSKWLTDTEEMVANQKPPSADYKVVKAQLQEQKFLKKMLVDRQGSMSSLVAMGREVAANCDASERAGIERQLRSLADRFDDLTERADARTSQLEQAMAVAKEFHDKLRPIVDWLDRAEKKIRDMELVPTDEEKITQKIREHSALHDDILRKKPALSELTEIAGELAGLVGDDEASAVADRVQELADRYSDLVNRSEGVGSLLENARARLRHLVVSYQKLQGWMQNMESRLAKYKVLAVHTEQLLAQMEDLADLTEEIANEQSTVDSTVDAGLELMKNISSDEAIQLKDKLDSLQRRYNELVTRGADLLKSTETALPLVQQFHGAHNRLSDWMHSAEATLQSADLREDAVQTLEVDVQEFRPVLENINQLGPQVCAIGPGEGAATIEGLVTRDNRRFDAIAQEVRRRSERVRASKQRSAEVLADVDSLLEWFREVDAQLREAEAPSSEPHVIRLQLKEHKALNDDIAAQKGRVRDVLDTAKRLLRETAQFEDGTSSGIMRDKMADLRETMDSVWTASGERLGLLESALGLAVHFDSSHNELVSWLDDKEREAKSLRPSVLRPQALIQDQAVTQRLLQSISEHKPLVDKLNKTGEALIRVVQPEEGIKVQDLLDSDNSRYDELKKLLKNRQEALEKALQESSEFSDKLEGMLRALTNAHDEVASAEPVSSHPPKIRQQLKENESLIDDVAKREDAFEAIKKAARDVIAKSPNDPAIKDIKRKMDKLEQLWNDVRDATKSRKRSLDEALDVATKFWNQLEAVVNALSEIEANLLAQEPPALKPNEVQLQTVKLQNIGAEIEETKPRVEEVRRTGAKLMNLVGDSEKPEVRKNIEDMDSAWDTVTSLFAKRRENLITAMEVAMEFHDNLRAINEALDKGEARFAGLGPLGEDIATIRRQMNDVKDLKAFLDPMMVKVESLNRQAAELFERSSADQAQGLKEAVNLVNSRWDDLQRGMAERNRQLENALLRLGQFQQALQELLAWIAATDRSLDTDLSPTAVDTHLLEIQLAKLKVLMNDMAAHQTSVEALNDAGRQIIEEGRSKSDSDSIQEKLTDLNSKWKKLMNKASERQTELEEALRQSHRFAAEIQDTLTWLGEIDSVMAASKPVGGLPETAAEQLDRFMVVYNELEESRPRVEAVLARGAERLKKSASAESSAHLAASLKTLKSRWESVTARANDKKIKLEIALKEAREFHDALQNFVDWLTSAEKTLSNLKPVSRVLETILGQIEEHKAFQKEVGVHREAMVQLDRQGTHLKYFCQKQDVILIKNLLVSVQHRWERVVSKSAERTRALDHGYKEAKDYHDSWFSLMSWLTDASTQLDAALREESSRTEEPATLKSRLNAHRELQKAVAAKQPTYDSVMRMGKALRDKAPKSDEAPLKSMAAELKELWNSVCSKAVERQRNLEEALLYCGQVKDALEALLDWLRKTHKELSEEGLVHGDLDTVQMLIEGHKKLEQELENRRPQVESVERSGRELSNKSESRAMSEQISEMGDLWRKTTELARKRGLKLQNALKQAEELHKAVHMLLEWLSDAEMKLRFVDSLPDDEIETRAQISEHEKFMREMNDKEREKDSTIRLAEEILSKAHPDGASVVKHWITIIQSRWDEVSSWAKQRRDMLQAQLRALQDMDTLLAELLAWLAEKEATLASEEVTPLPDTIPATQRLIDEHTVFMEDMAKRTHEVDTVIKAKTVKERKQSKKTSKDESRQSMAELHELQRKQSISLRSSREALDRRGSRSSPTKDVVDSTLPHIGPKFPAKGSKTPEPQFKCARSRQLYDRWRSVWLMAWERQRRLRDHLAHLGELERLANFSWDEWRKRFLRFMNHKKSRLTDLFRKMDKNNDGLIPRDDFIDGIIKTKFDTSKLEMGAVADMFDHNAEGLIDWKEFIAALRPDWEERKPETEAEKIHDEVKRLVMLCTCRQKFRVFQVGEGKYRFGDSQKLRLVRILRSTVMVRVGGGWVALEEFLVKNDPCRAKGRTNIELREQFILADNVSQSMSAFKPKLSTERRTPTPTSSTGPITKIREKSTRSVPMTARGTPTAGSRGSRGSAGSLSDVDSVSAPMTPSFRKSSLRTPVSTLGGGSLPGSRSSSRQGSKPPSRHGSSLSLASSDDGAGGATTPSSRIPRRSAPSRSGSSASTSQATAQRRATAPSTPRSTNLSRASSIPTLISHRSKIPVYVGNSDASQISSASSSGTPKTPSSAGKK